MTAPTTNISQHLLSGTTLKEGAYQISEYLAEGGFGVTYTAFAPGGDKVVIKECFPKGISMRSDETYVSAIAASDQSFYEKSIRLFLKEAETLKLITSRYVVRVRDIFQENNTAYMVTDFVDGPDFDKVIRVAPNFLTPDYLLHFASHLLEAMEDVHKSGILHRDIKPANVLIDPNERPVIIDFGAARVEATQQSVKLSRSIRVVSNGFSPNEYYIHGVEQSPASDLYSIAATLWAAIERQDPPPADERSGALHDGRPDPYQPLAGRHPDYPPLFLSLIDKNMALARKDRLQSAQEWLTQLRPVLAQQHKRDADPPPAKRGLATPLVAGLAGVVGAGVMALAATPAAAAAVGPGRGMPMPPSLQELQTRAIAAEREAGRVTALWQDAQRSNAQLSGQVAQSNAQVSDLRGQLSAAQSAGTTLQRQLDEAAGTLRDQQFELGQLETQVLAGTSEVNDLRTRLNAALAGARNLPALQAQIDRLQGQLSGETQRADALRLQLSDAQQAINDLPGLQAQLGQLRGQLADETARADGLRLELGTAQGTISDLQRQLGSGNTVATQLQREVDRLNGLLQSRDTDVARLQALLTEAQRAARAFEDEGRQAANTVLDREREIDRLNRQLQTQVSAAADLQSQLAAAQQSADALRAQLGTGADATVRLEREIERLNALVADQTAEVTNLRNQLEIARRTPQVPLTTVLTGTGTGAGTVTGPATGTGTGTATGTTTLAATLNQTQPALTQPALTQPALTQQPAARSNSWTDAQVTTLTLTGHTEEVRDLAFSPDGRRLVSVSTDNTVAVWDTQTGDRLRVLRETTNNVLGVAYSADGSYFVTVGDHPDMLVWNAASFQVERRIPLGAPFTNSVDTSPRGNLIVAGVGEGEVRVWNRAGTLLARVQGHGFEEVRSVAFSPDGQTVASGATDNFVRFWRASDLTPLTEYSHDQWVTVVGFDQIGQRLTSVDLDGTILVATRQGRDWRNVATQRVARGTFPRARLTPGQNEVILASRNGEISAAGLDFIPARTLATQPVGVLALEVSNDNRRLAVGLEDGTVILLSRR